GSCVPAGYAENAHVCKPRTGDPAGDSRMTFWYGTKDPAQRNTLYGVMVWGAQEGRWGEHKAFYYLKYNSHNQGTNISQSLQ
ncbi:hypothetical protein C7212DRAFT_181392, partial [Tuber magnatum]